MQAALHLQIGLERSDQTQHDGGKPDAQPKRDDETEDVCEGAWDDLAGTCGPEQDLEDAHPNDQREERTPSHG